MVRANGGVVMVNFAPSFVSPEMAVARRGGFDAYKDAMARFPEDQDARRKVMEQFNDEHPAPPATLSQVADHMDHIRRVAGGETVGIGSDFDGIGDVPEGLEDVSKFPDLVVELINRGWPDEEISRALGGNLLRVLAAAEVVAARLQKEKPPSTATLAALDGSLVAVP
jgi:membrane dipeptidase